MSARNTFSDTLANAVADRILEDIASSGLQEGQLFMTSDQVGERYSVSRSIAREAISRLQALGVLESRQRKGLLVRRPDPVRLTQQWLPFYCRASHAGDLRTLAEFRYALEVGAIELAIVKGTDEQIAELERCAAEFEAIASKRGHDAAADEADLAFHKAILDMTGNALVSGMHRVLSDYFQASRFKPEPLKAIREHHVIAEAFRRRDADTARAIMRAHLEGTVRE